MVPPDYALRPPAPGEPRPQELQPESAARQALIGQRVDSLERSRESTDKFVDSLRTSVQRQEFQINQLGEGLKGLAQMGRPK